MNQRLLSSGGSNCNANNNPIGRSNQNLILNTSLYDVEFPGGEITKLAPNIIAESMHDQCDVSGNEYIFLDSFIDYKKMSNLSESRIRKLLSKEERL